MNKLLAHSNNTSFNKSELFSLAEQFVFDVDFDKDVDLYIDDKLSSDRDLKPKIQNADILFIKVSLSQNYLEYLGLRLAYHIRLTKTLGEKANLPIVFIAEESFQYLGISCEEPSILFTRGIYLIRESMEDYCKILKWHKEGLIKPLEEFDTFVNSIYIKPPANYQSHHSIANEWALSRYFLMLQTNESDESYYKNLEDSIKNLPYLKTLHFKYSEAKASRQKFNPKKHGYTPPLIDGLSTIKIGIIDDEINKGWLAFYEYIFRKSEAHLIPFEELKKDKKKEDFIKQMQEWILKNIESEEPIDLFIIDLRLHDDDFSEKEVDNLSGMQALKFIKSKNPGIQVVVSTASNKVWSFQKCLEYGASHYAIKESPETYSNREETKNILSHLNRQIKYASKKIFLADLFRDIRSLKEEGGNFSKDQKADDFKGLIFGGNGILDQIFNLLIIDSTSENIINQCLLLCFQILESYCDLPMVGSFRNDRVKKLSSGFVWLRSGEKKDVFTSLEDDKILTWFELCYGKFDFQTEESPQTPTSFTVFDKMEIRSSYKSGLDASSLVKMICVLYFRDNIPENDVKEIIKFRYYRSNVAAHLTGNIKPELKITAKDIIFFVKLFKKIFIT